MMTALNQDVPKIEALFFDIDGTLAASNGRVLPSTRKAVIKAREMGILCCIATGRSVYQLKNHLDNLEFDAFITYNGQYAYTASGQILYENPFSKETVQRLAQFGDKESRQLIFGGRERIEGSWILRFGQNSLVRKLLRFLPREFPEKGLKKSLQKMQRKSTGRYETLPLLDEAVFQCVMFSPPEETSKLKRLFPDCHFTRSNRIAVDIVPKDGSKLDGIRAVCQHYGIELEEVMAFGDSWNDEEMLQGVGIGVAMGNSNPDIKAAADYITASNNDDGIYKALIHYQVIPEGGGK